MSERGGANMRARSIGAAWLVLPLVLGACSAKNTATPTSSAPTPSTTTPAVTTPPTTAPPTTLARATASTLAKPTSATVARDSSIVSAEMALAAAKAGAVDRGYFLERLMTVDACRACIGSEWFARWCAAPGGRIVGTSNADGRYFADGGPVYCYPGAKPLPGLNLLPYTPAPYFRPTMVECMEPGRRDFPFVVPSTICPSGSRLVLGQD